MMCVRAVDVAPGGRVSWRRALRRPAGRRAQRSRPPAQRAGSGGRSPPAEFERVLMLTAGRSTVLTTDFDITRIAITNPEIADAVVVQPREVLIDGKAPERSASSCGASPAPQHDVVVDPGVIDAGAAAASCSPARTSGRGQRRRDHSVGPGVEQRGDAPGRRDRAATKANAASSTCCSCPAAPTASR